MEASRLLLVLLQMCVCSNLSRSPQSPPAQAWQPAGTIDVNKGLANAHLMTDFNLGQEDLNWAWVGPGTVLCCSTPVVPCD